MEKFFVNFSNHPSEKWEDEQKKAAQIYGKLVDVPFPNVLPSASEEEVAQLAEEMVKKIMECQPAAVMCQGEFTLSFQVAAKLKQQNITVVAACSERCVRESGDEKIVKFRFCRFRKF